MISFWHLTAVCCIPISNPRGRAREMEILRLAAQGKFLGATPMGKHPIGRWEASAKSRELSSIANPR